MRPGIPPDSRCIRISADKRIRPAQALATPTAADEASEESMVGRVSDRTTAGKGRPSVPGGRRRSAELLETRCDHSAVDGKRRSHKVSEGTDRQGSSQPAEQIADPPGANIG
ncbi:putative cell division protein FtsW [Trichinella spiralis]|uniref:Uncharacterized protein n=1 Tax=Trichinella spiralis TaxID=6334 RepID=E5SGR1_TRISP|nr:putative cell division protein FtsW [Trichinella spiralis]KRY27706.1 hypothetical protein T01_15858 [Trichinella spiralis]